MRVHPNAFARTAVVAVTVTGCTLALSCGALSRPAPDRALFAIDPGPPPAASPSRESGARAADPPARQAVLRVRRLRVLSPYDAGAFVYRAGADEFRTDYYNGFVAPPAELLTGRLIEWLARTGPFDAVVDAGSAVPARYLLEGTVTALYGDYADRAAPTAVIAIKVFVLDESGAAGSNARIAFQKEYRAAAPIQPGTAAGLVRGWGQALRQISEELTADLPRGGSAGPPATGT
jgi:ABC-type uncharacterized transport system auxiliary subunit